MGGEKEEGEGIAEQQPTKGRLWLVLSFSRSVDTAGWGKGGAANELQDTSVR